MPTTELIFLGTDSVTPVAGDETSCLLINRHILFDAGWCAALRMQDHGVTPMDLDLLIFSHMHHDHYLGLPHVLFHRWMKQSREPLTILGPQGDLPLVLDRALAFLQAQRFDYRPVVEVRELAPGDSLEVAGLRIRTCASLHPVPGLCYRLDDPASGASVALSGDTAYCEALIELARGADLLVHEASHGPAAQRHQTNAHGHSGSPDAAEIAAAAGVRRLALTHGAPGGRAAAVAAAQAVFASSFWPAVGEKVALP